MNEKVLPGAYNTWFINPHSPVLTSTPQRYDLARHDHVMVIKIRKLSEHLSLHFGEKETLLTHG
jgi:hypothetical protein